MKNYLFLSLFFLMQISFAQFPTTPKRPVVDDYFGTKVTDNYRWLEDMKNPEVQAWFKAQADYSDGILNKISGRDKLMNDMIALDKLKKADYYSIKEEANRVFYIKTLAGEKVGKLYYRELPNGVEQLLVDPEKYQLGKIFSIYDYLPSHDGKKIALAMTEGGAEIGSIRILDVDSKALLPETIAPTWGSATAWTKDNQAFMYAKLNSADNTNPEMLKNIKSMLHKVGTDVNTDIEIASRAKYSNLGILPEYWVTVNFSDDYQYIFLNIGSVKNEILEYYAPISEWGRAFINWKPLLKYEDEVTDFKVIGKNLYLLSHKDASNFKILLTSIENPDIANAKVIVPEGVEVIKNISNSKNHLFYRTSNGITSRLFQYNALSGQKKEVILPQSGNNYLTPVSSSQNDKTVVVSTGWITPPTVYDYDATVGKIQPSKFFSYETNYKGLENYAVKEVEVKGHDGVMIPLSIIYPKNIKLDGNTVCALDGYGAYGVSISPYFIEPIVALVQQNAILAVAHVRGGGEKGEAWHLAGYKDTKPNTWKDFISCGEYLVKEGYTSPKKMFGMGMSAGGILIGRAITERPDLFAAAISEVSCSNILRSEQTPNGDNNIPEFGSTKKQEDIKAMLEMDAVSHVKQGEKYPAVIVRTGMNDPRVSPWEPGKLAASLQNSTTSGKPVIFQVNYENGHFTEDKMITYKEISDMFAFCLWQCGHPDFQPKSENAISSIENTKWQAKVFIPEPTTVNFEFKNGDFIMKSLGGVVLETMKYSLNINELTLIKISGGSPCAEKSKGIYKIEIKDNKLYFVSIISEECDDRGQSISKDGMQKQ